MPERPNAGPNDPVFIGIRTDLLGSQLNRPGQVGINFVVDPSHGDGFGSLTEPQRAVYIHILKAAVKRLEDEGKQRIKPAPPGHILMN